MHIWTKRIIFLGTCVCAATTWRYSRMLQARAHRAKSVGFVKTIKGSMTVRDAHSNNITDAKQGDYLYLDDMLKTGDNSDATIVIKPSHIFAIGSNSYFILKKTDDPNQPIAGILLEGDSHDASPSTSMVVANEAIEQPDTAVSTHPKNHSQLSATHLQIKYLDIARESAAPAPPVPRIKFGDIDIAIQEQTQLKLGLIDAVVQQVLPPVAQEVTLDEMQVTTSTPIDFVLETLLHITEIQSKNAKNWLQASAHKVALHKNDTIRTTKNSMAALLVGDTARTILYEQSQLHIDHADKTATIEEAYYSLEQGHIQINLSNTKKKITKQQILLNNYQLKIAPSVMRAMADIEEKDKHYHVALRFGQMMLMNGLKVDAGEQFDIVNGDIKGAIRPLPHIDIDIYEKSSSTVFYRQTVPPLNFNWSASHAATSLFEMSTDKEFLKIIIAERLHKNNFVCDTILPGKYYWRINQDNDTRSVLNIVQEKDAVCKNCVHSNTLEDTGEQTAVYYQEMLPNIVLKWQPIDGAKDYDIKIFSDNKLDIPFLTEHVHATSVQLPHDKLTDGKYYWLVIANDKLGHPIHTGPINGLMIIYHNAVSLLSIKTPKDHASIAASKVVVDGQVGAESKIFINNKSIELDDQGYFDESIVLQKGTNAIVFHVVTDNGSHYFYVRYVKH